MNIPTLSRMPSRAQTIAQLEREVTEANAQKAAAFKALNRARGQAVVAEAARPSRTVAASQPKQPALATFELTGMSRDQLIAALDMAITGLKSPDLSESEREELLGLGQQAAAKLKTLPAPTFAATATMSSDRRRELLGMSHLGNRVLKDEPPAAFKATAAMSALQRWKLLSTTSLGKQVIAKEEAGQTVTFSRPSKTREMIDKALALTDAGRRVLAARTA